MIGGYSTMQGPLFDRRAGEAVRSFLLESEREVAEEGVDLVRYVGGKSFRYLSSVPTGNFARGVQASRTFGGWTVRDDVIYGPWLEGVSKRNAATRFKGYALYRRAAQLLGTTAHLIAERVLPLYLRRMGGR
ncbi:hypothetical protein RB614_37765 [Phytohabitans sp. ZYX-F-186]|uniref:Uncharacterized protein n=1 Tax=Phytohabitans maris TaxID=3071409 RepID=A0ABU0ZTE0_9ACTN|nr:hypothetical protein [Phytohabitans sp. ZYX-F-186]MDQ7910257.1 hypothetical protein [Phytohabitans sp. ZYX-F-186]